jgi:hypothetical protein
MAGSKILRRYVDDAVVSFTVNVDESNSRATVNGKELMAPRTATHPNEPKGFAKRYVLATLKSNPNIKRKFWVGNTQAIGDIITGTFPLKATVYPTADDAAGTQVDWSITAYRGEKRAIPKQLDTTAGDSGLTDGTAPLDA